MSKSSHSAVKTRKRSAGKTIRKKSSRPSPRNKAVSAKPQAASHTKPDNGAEYGSNGQGMYYIPSGKTEKVMLCGFNARITSVVTEDDGLSSTRKFKIVGKVDGEPLQEITVDSHEFENGSWIGRHWTPKAIIEPGRLNRTLTAIKQLSNRDGHEDKMLFGHTGWIEKDGHWYYLFNGGAIGTEGLNTSIEVDLPGRLENYEVGQLPPPKQRKSSIRACLEFLKLAPPEKVYPLFASIFVAPLMEAFQVDCSIFIFGRSGTFKTATAAVMQAFFGSAFRAQTLPANWSSTTGAIERSAFGAKDAIFVVDEFHPDDAASREAREKAERIFRGAANGTGRERLTGPGYYSRGLIVATGEKMPHGMESLFARMLLVEFQAGDVDVSVLTELQKHAQLGTFASIMADYLKWLAPQMDQLKKLLPAAHQQHRDKNGDIDHHARTASNLASLKIGLDMFLDYARNQKAITGTQSSLYKRDGQKALQQAFNDHRQITSCIKPGDLFIRLLKDALTNGNAHIEASKPAQSRKVRKKDYGWIKKSGKWIARGTLIGWIDRDNLYLRPKEAIDIARTRAKAIHAQFPARRKIQGSMDSSGYLASKDSQRGTYCVRVTIDGQRMSVLHMCVTDFEKIAGGGD